MDLDAVADDLYGLAPSEFTAARNALAAQARKEGDRQLASAVARLRRPTKSAWLANRLVRERQEGVEELLRLGEVMRDAHEQLAGDDLRELSRRRRDLVAALADEGAELGVRAGEAVTADMVRDLQATLEAAVADAAAGEAVRAGRLTDALSYSGFGPVELAPSLAGPDGHDRSAPVTPGPGRRTSGKKLVPAAVPAAAAGAGREAGAAGTAGAARAGLEDAERDAAHARRAAEVAAAHTADAVRADAALRARIDALDAELSELRRQVGTAARAVREARREQAVADRAAASADARLNRARG